MAEIIGRVGWRNYVSPISPLWNNLVAYWSGDNTANDSKGTYNGTLVNGATYSTGKISNGFILDGVNDYVNISPSLGSTFSSPSSAHSYSAWIYPTSLAGYNWIIQNGLNNSGTSMILNGANLCFFIQGGNNQTTSSATLTVNTWTMVTVVYNGAGSVSFYKNGVLSNSNSASWTESVYGTNTYIGSYVGAVHFFDGKIDEVGAWNRALTAAEVTELYNAGSGKQYAAPAPTSIITTGLIMNLDASNSASYPGTGTTWTDLTGNGNNGTLTNGTSYSSANSGTLVFDGVNDYVRINTGLSASANTVSLWFKQSSSRGTGLFETSANGAPLGNGSPYLFVGLGANFLRTYNEPTGYSANSTYIPTNWYNVTITGSGSTQKVYMNGVLTTTKTISTSGNYNSAMDIGVSYAGYFNGNVPVVHAYNRALTQEEITTNFNVLKSRYGL